MLYINVYYILRSELLRSVCKAAHVPLFSVGFIIMYCYFRFGTMQSNTDILNYANNIMIFLKNKLSCMETLKRENEELKRQGGSGALGAAGFGNANAG